jgi:hypothetical protein
MPRLAGESVASMSKACWSCFNSDSSAESVNERMDALSSLLNGKVISIGISFGHLFWRIQAKYLASLIYAVNHPAQECRVTGLTYNLGRMLCPVRVVFYGDGLLGSLRPLPPSYRLLFDCIQLAQFCHSPGVEVSQG